MKNPVSVSQWSNIAASAALATLAIALCPKPGNAVPVWAYSADVTTVTITGATIITGSAFGTGESTAHLVQGFVDYGAKDNQASRKGGVRAPQAESGPGPFPPNFTVQSQGITLGGARGGQGLFQSLNGAPNTTGAAGVAEVYLEGPGSGSATAENSAFIRLQQTAPLITFTIDAAAELAVLTTALGDASQAQTKLSLTLIGPSNVPGIVPSTTIWNPCGSTAPANKPNLNNCNQPGNGLTRGGRQALSVNSDPASLNNSITCTDAGCFNDYLAAFDTWTLTADFGVGNILAADFDTYNQVLVSGLLDVGLAALPNIPSIVAEPDPLPILSVALAGLFMLGVRHKRNAAQKIGDAKRQSTQKDFLRLHPSEIDHRHGARASR